MLRLLALGCVVLAIANGVGEPNFECKNAQTASEKLICGNAELNWPDRQLARLYARARKEAPEAKRAALVDSQRRFLVARDACMVNASPLACVAGLYETRMKELALSVNVHDAYASFVRGNTGGLRIARVGYTGAVQLWASGENGHECGFEQDNLTQTGKGLLRWREKIDTEECRLTVIPEGDDMRVETDNCQFYCGARAKMDGVYARVH